ARRRPPCRCSPPALRGTPHRRPCCPLRRPTLRSQAACRRIAVRPRQCRPGASPLSPGRAAPAARRAPRRARRRWRCRWRGRRGDRSCPIPYGAMSDAHRLPRTVEPQRYELTLTPDLGAATFAGEERVRVLVHEPVTEIVLHAADLVIH